RGSALGRPDPQARIEGLARYPCPGAGRDPPFSRPGGAPVDLSLRRDDNFKSSLEPGESPIHFRYERGGTGAAGSVEVVEREKPRLDPAAAQTGETAE